MRRFEDQAVLVTGASRGLGRAIAVAFVFPGYRVGEVAARETLAQVEAAGGQGAVLGFDVTDAPQVDDAVGKELALRGKLDVVADGARVSARSRVAGHSSTSDGHARRAGLRAVTELRPRTKAVGGGE